jgi:hypothetical protein
MPIQSALAQVGVAKQTVKGTPISNPTYGHGVTNGTVLTIDVAQGLEDHTSGTRVSPAVNRTGVMPGMDFSCRAHSRTTGLYLFGALGSIATTGAGPYTHTITTGADLPYLTAFGRMGSNIYAVNDLKVDSLELNFNQTEPIEIAVSGMGTTANYAATFTATTDDTLATYFAAHTGTFSVDVDGASGTAATAKIQSGSIKINNNLESIMISGSIAPDDVFPGRQEIEVSFDIIPDDLNLWRTIITGTSSGTTAASAVTYGTFSVAFTNGADSLTIAATRVAFTADFPDADPAGGVVTLSLEGLAVQPLAGGTPITATLINTAVSY